MKIPSDTINWLLEMGSPAIKYNTRLLVGNKNPDRTELLSDPFIIKNIQLLKKWDKEIITRHDKPDLFIHIFSMLVDLGVKCDDPGMPLIIKKLLKHINDKGIPESLIQIPVVFGGSGKPELSWLICDFPVILFGLLASGVKDSAVTKSLKTLKSLCDDNGYRCIGAMNKFRGPGRKDDFCPIACLYAAKVLCAGKKYSIGTSAINSVEALLNHWEQRKEKKYYMFGIGTDFMKLKYPFVWYNILHVLDTISRFEAFKKDKRVMEMADILISKAGTEFRFKPESIYMAYKGNDFADKKIFSPTITLMALRILMRLGIITR